MNRQNTIAASLIVCGLGFLACDGGGPDPTTAAGSAQTTTHALVLRNPITLGKRVRLEGRRFFSYRPQERPPTTPEEALARADRMLKATGSAGFMRAPDEERVLPGTIVLRSTDDPSGSLRLELRTDRLLFKQGLLPYRELLDTPGLPAPEVSRAMALRQVRALGLLPPAEEMVLAHIGGLDLGEADRGASLVFHKLRTVRFDRVLGELPVFGRSRLLVHLGQDGRLVGVVRDWVPVEARPLEPAEILTDEELDQAIWRRLREDLSGDEMVIQQSDIVLWDRGGGRMEPAVHLAGRMIDLEPTPRDYSYDTVVPIMRRPALRYPFTPDPRARELIKQDSDGGGDPGAGRGDDD